MIKKLVDSLAFLSALASKVVSDGVDCTKEAIKEAVEKKSNKYSTLDTQMYSVIVDTIRDVALLHDKNDKELIYDAAEVFLKSLKNPNQNISDKIKKCLSKVDIASNEENCKQFQNKFHERIFKKENEELYKAIDWIRAEECAQTLSKIDQKVSEKEMGNCEIENGLSSNQQNKFTNNKKGYYCDIWNQNMFLQHKNNGKTIRLRDAFVVPNYHIHQHKIFRSMNDTLENLIDRFINYQDKSTMLITGVPGIGKSSIVSWIANKYEKNDKIIILRFRDWDKEDLDEGILKAIRKTLECNKMDLEYKTLILDGFDEIKLLEKREELLFGFLNDISDYEFLKCIITSRPHYIQTVKFNNHIELAPFDQQKISEFYIKIKGVELNQTIGDENIDVYGIPVILYMSIMCGLDITNHSSKPEIYNHIFAKNGGIFDRFSFDEKPYSEGAQILRDANNIEKYLDFLRKTAFQLFKLNGANLKLEKDDIPKLIFAQKEISILEFPLKPLFEDTQNIEFIHRSIYEYFVSEYIFVCIKDVIKGTKEEIADKMGIIFKDNIFSSEILEFLQYKIKSSEHTQMFDIVLNVFQLMLDDGMTYYISERCKPVIKCEQNIFYNMLQLIHLWEMECINLGKSISSYLLLGQERTSNTLRGINLSKINLRGMNLERLDLEAADLRGADLRGVNLSRVNLKGADLRGVKLGGVDLKGVDLRETYLTEADLSGARLNGADLSGADLRKAYLTETDLTEVNLREANLSSANLRKADLSGADLRGADLRGANLSEVDLRGAKLWEKKLWKIDSNEIVLEKTYLNLSIFDEEQVKHLEQKYTLENIRVYLERAKKL